MECGVLAPHGLLCLTSPWGTLGPHGTVLMDTGLSQEEPAPLSWPGQAPPSPCRPVDLLCHVQKGTKVTGWGWRPGARGGWAAAYRKATVLLCFQATSLC